MSSGILLRSSNLRGRRPDFHLVIAGLLLWTVALQGREKKSTESFGMGLTVTVQASEAEILQAVQDVVADGVIQGSKEYNKDEYVSGAEAVDSTPVFPKWSGLGRVFYKVRQNALDPRNFKDSGDSGTLAVRYVVQAGDQKSAILKIDAIFVDDFHRRVHPSNGSVESAEYAAIQDRLDTAHLEKQHSAEEEKRQKQELAATELERNRKRVQEEVAIAQSPDETLQQYVQRLRHELERTVKSPGARLRSAPFRSASSIIPLQAGEQVVILVSTPYWYGVQTESGQSGWVHRSQLELLP